MSTDFYKIEILTATEALLLLFGLGTWKFLPKRSALSSSSLELELSNGLMPCILAARFANCACRFRRGKGTGGRVPCMLACGKVPAKDRFGYPKIADDGLVGAVTGSGCKYLFVEIILK